MPRLSQFSYDLLAAEVDRLCQNPLEQVRADIVLKRLKRFRQAEGPPLTIDEMREAVEDIFPEFDEKVLKRAVKANQTAKVQARLGCLGASVATLAGVAGGIWLLNLPYPMIRWPVARVAPIVLLPSYIQMDHDYRQAISLVEQADQLVNQATSAQDIELGDQKVAQAQHHLDGLPVWFLGYYPVTYCNFFSCTWRFTYDEFQRARAEVGRMEAVIFQERNAQQQLQTGTTTIDAAQQAYQTAESGADKSAALANWQQGMDSLTEIPQETLAGRQAATKLQAYQRDYQQIAGTVAGGNRSNSLIEAAQAFAYEAAVEGQNPPHSAETWDRIADLWQTAIARLDTIPVDDPGYGEAQVLLAEYQKNLGVVQENVSVEKASSQALEAAKQRNAAFLGQNLENMQRNQIASQLQGIVNNLEQVQPGTTSYAEAQRLLTSANQKLAELSR